MNESPRIRALSYLGAHHVVTVATSGPEGLWAAAVFYVNHDLDLYFLSAPQTRHALNIAAVPEVSATVQEDYGDWPEIKGIQLEGRAEQIRGAEQARALAWYGRKFPLVADPARAPATILAAMRKVAWYRIRPSRLYFIDNSRGFGHRDEVAIHRDPDDGL